VNVQSRPARPETQTSAAEREPLRSAFSVLGDTSFRRYFVGQTCSAFGSALSTVALAFAVLSLTRSAVALGVVLAGSRLPQIIFALLGGALGDRFSRRLIMLSTDAFRALLQAATAATLILHAADLPLIAALQILSGVGSAMFAPAANGLVNNLAPDGRNREATSMLGFAANAASISGLAVAGAIVGALGPGPAFAVDAATFAVSTLSLALIDARSLAKPLLARRGLIADIGEGWRTVRQARWLLTHCIYVCLLNTLALCPFFVLGPLIASRRLGGAPAWAAIAIAWTVGSLAGNITTTRWQPRRPIVMAIALSIGLIPILVSLALPLTLGLVLATAVPAGAESAISSTLVLVALQDNIPDHLLARATSFETIGSLIAVPLGMSFAGIAATWSNTQSVLLFSATWVLLSSIVALATPSVRRLQTSDQR